METMCSGCDNLPCHFPKWLYQCTFTQANLRAFWYLSHPQKKWWGRSLFQSSGCTTVSPCGFNLHVPNNQRFLAPFHLLIGPCMLSVENLFRSFDFPFLIDLPVTHEVCVLQIFPSRWMGRGVCMCLGAHAQQVHMSVEGRGQTRVFFRHFPTCFWRQNVVV